VKIGKSGLASVLLEGGEETAAVLLIRSPLPEELDTERDLDGLSQLGLDIEAVDELIAMAVERGQADDGDGERFQHTLSRRYADLVQHWIAGRAGGQS
jgi:hypothetical protein